MNSTETQGRRPPLKPWLLRQVTRLVRKVYTEACERRYNIRTGFETVNFLGKAHPEFQAYQPMDYLLLHSFIGPLNLKPDDVVFDIGCGMGRVLCVFARKEVKKCVGIELSRELVEMARSNAERLRAPKAAIQVQQADARVADYSEGTIFWMFNPFGASILQSTLEQIKTTLVPFPRRIRIAYVNPLHESVFQRCEWLRCTGSKKLPVSCIAVSYWSNL